jgi:tetraacyldisaccharide 4'-kinase
MLNPSEFRDLVSGRRHGVGAAALRGLLRAAETPYSIAVAHRNRRYDLGRAAIHRVEVPVVSIGNLTLGGTGKTPLVRWLAQWFIAHNVRVAIVSRGYGSKPGHKNDEALELEQALPSVPHIQNPDRVAAARMAIDAHHCELILLDDGFQHRRLGRNLDIVLLDALEPFGFEHVFPRGTLREPTSGLQRADVVCLSRADLATTNQRSDVRRRAAQLAPDAVWCEVTHAPSGLLNMAGDRAPLTMLTGKRVVAFCGIGNPAGFRHTLAGAGCEIVAWREFPDHCGYTAADLAQLADVVRESKADLVVCTHKDLVKVARSNLGGLPLWAVTVEIRFLAGQAALETKIAGIKS